MSDPVAVELHGELRQVKSLVDHSYSVLLVVGEDCLSQVKQLMGWVGDEVRAVLVDETNEPNKPEEIGGKNGSGSRRKRKVRKGE